MFTVVATMGTNSQTLTHYTRSDAVIAAGSLATGFYGARRVNPDAEFTLGYLAALTDHWTGASAAGIDDTYNGFSVTITKDDEK